MVSVAKATESAATVAVPVVPTETSPLITTGLKFVPSPTRMAPEVFVAMKRSSPKILKSAETLLNPLSKVKLLSVPETFPVKAIVAAAPAPRVEDSISVVSRLKVTMSSALEVSMPLVPPASVTVVPVVEPPASAVRPVIPPPAGAEASRTCPRIQSVPSYTQEVKSPEAVTRSVEPQTNPAAVQS